MRNCNITLRKTLNLPAADLVSPLVGLKVWFTFNEL